jgi:hypothetical protein
VQENLRRTAGDAGPASSRRVMAIPECSDPVPLTVVLEKSGYKSLRDLRRQDPALHWKLVAQHRKTGRIAWKERMRNARAATLAMIEGALIASLNLDCPELLTDTALRLSFETSTPLAFHFPKLCAAIIAKRAEWKRRRWAEKEAIVHQSARLSAAHRGSARDQSPLPEQNSYKETLRFSGLGPGSTIL